MIADPQPIRRASIADLPAVEELEALCFVARRRETRRSLRRSISSPHQETWVIGPPGKSLRGELIVRLHRNTLRITSVCVSPDSMGSGLGSRLLAHAISRAAEHGCRWISLEADAADKRLTRWYQQKGFSPTRRLRHYYGRNEHALRMRRSLDQR